jgi:hypothetical protein
VVCSESILGGELKSPASISTKAAVFIWKAASALSLGRTRKQAERIIGTLSTWTGSSSSTPESTATELTDPMKATREVQFQTKKFRSRHIPVYLNTYR